MPHMVLKISVTVFVDFLASLEADRKCVDVDDIHVFRGLSNRDVASVDYDYVPLNFYGCNRISCMGSVL